MKEQIIVSIDAEVKRQYKVICASKGVTMGELIKDFINQYIKKNK